MAVYIANSLWGTTVPYVAADGWAADHIGRFNKAVRKNIFVPRTNETNYVEFTTGGGHAACVIGRKGGKQTLAYNQTPESILHEMGHCLGLGHENFHSRWPARAILTATTNRSIHADAFRLNMKKYTDLGSFDRESIMLYGPAAFKITDEEYMQVAKFRYAKNTQLSPLDVLAIRQLYALVPDS